MEQVFPPLPVPEGLESVHPSRAPAPLGKRSNAGTTQTGLAGLKRTLSGTGKTEPPPGTTETSVLAGLKTKSVPPSLGGPGTAGKKLSPAKTLAGVGPAGTPSSPPVRLDDAKRPKHKTLAGVGADTKTSPEMRGAMKTLAGVGGEESPLKRSSTLSGLEKKGTTNLGLGTTPSSPPPLTGQAPPSVRGEAEPEEESRPKQETIPGAAAPEGTTDGSVTFDLEALEALGDGFDDDDETTQILDPKKALSESSGLIADGDDTEELGDSSLMSIEELNEEADLPAPAADLPSPVETSEEEIGASALMDLDDADLPAPAADLPAVASPADPMGATAIGLPSPVADLPSPAAGLPATAAGLPAPAGDLPVPAGEELGLPVVGGIADVPARPRTASGEMKLGLGQTQVAAPGPAGLDFGSATRPQATTQGTVDELDELSVAAILPEDDALEAGPDSLDFGGSMDALAGGTLPLGGQSAPQSVPDPMANTTLGQGSPLAAGFDLAQEAPAAPQPPMPEPMAQQAPAAPRPPGSPLLLDVTPLSSASR